MYLNAQEERSCLNTAPLRNLQRALFPRSHLRVHCWFFFCFFRSKGHQSRCSFSLWPMQYRMHARTPFECTNYELRSHTGCTQNEKCQQCTCLTLYLLPTRENGSEYTLTNIFTKKNGKKSRNTHQNIKIAFFFLKNNYGTMADYRKQSSSGSCQPLSKGALTIVPMLGGSFGELLTFRGWWPRVEAVNPPH